MRPGSTARTASRPRCFGKLSRAASRTWNSRSSRALVEQPQTADEHRRERRHPLIWSGVVHHDYQSNPVRLRNISSTGALVECQTPLRVGAEPLLDLGEAGQVFATVTWAVGDQAGLKFQKPFELAHLAKTKPDLAPAHWDRPSYLSPAQPQIHRGTRNGDGCRWASFATTSKAS